MKPLLAALLIMMTLVLSGCETFYGLGRDIENLGKGVERAGKWVQEKIE